MSERDEIIAKARRRRYRKLGIVTLMQKLEYIARIYYPERIT